MKDEDFFFALIFIILIPSCSCDLVGIDPGTIFAPSDSDTQYVLNDVSMNSISINSECIYLEEHIYHLEPVSGTATIWINMWSIRDMAMEISAIGDVNVHVGSFAPYKTVMFDTNVNYEFIADINGELEFVFGFSGINDFRFKGFPAWDVIEDWSVNYIDISNVVFNYGYEGDWIPADIIIDGIVDYADISCIITHYGE